MTDLLSAAVAKRAHLKHLTNAMRLINGMGDGMPGLIIDQYASHFCAQVFDKKWLTRADELTAFIKAAFKPDYFILKDRTQSAFSNPDAINGIVLIESPQGSGTVVEEYAVKFKVDLNDGLNAGLFLDMRPHRHSVGKLAKAKRVLNCFAYTCSFGVHARKHQAADVVNVDISKRILERGRDNYALNNITPGEHEFIRADAADYLERAVKKNNSFDLIIIDPPSFARGEKKVFQVKRDLPVLLANAVRVLNPNGTIFVSSNFNGLRHEDIEKMMANASAGRKMTKTTRVLQDKDFPGTNKFKESYLVGLCAHIQ